MVLSGSHTVFKIVTKCLLITSSPPKITHRSQNSEEGSRKGDCLTGPEALGGLWWNKCSYSQPGLKCPGRDESAHVLLLPAWSRSAWTSPASPQTCSPGQSHSLQGLQFCHQDRGGCSPGETRSSPSNFPKDLHFPPDLTHRGRGVRWFPGITDN